MSKVIGTRRFQRSCMASLGTLDPNSPVPVIGASSRNLSNQNTAALLAIEIGCRDLQIVFILAGKRALLNPKISREARSYTTCTFRFPPPSGHPPMSESRFTKGLPTSTYLFAIQRFRSKFWTPVVLMYKFTFLFMKYKLNFVFKFAQYEFSK